MKKKKKKRQLHKEEKEEEKGDIISSSSSIIIIISSSSSSIIIIIISSSSSSSTLNIPHPFTNGVPELVTCTVAISDTRRNLASNQHLFATLRYKLHFQRANPKPTRPDAKTC